MKLATLANGRPDGRLVIVSPDGERYAAAEAIAPTLQDALERWDAVEPALRALAAELAAGGGTPLAGEALEAPLPRAWQWLDGSAFPNHGVLMQMAYNSPPIETDLPLMYQGMSHCFLAPTADVPLPDEAHGIDFEGEFGVITTAVPMGTNAEDAAALIRLVVQINDWSLRTLAGPEMRTGFGWVQAKPACSVAPFAVTPDALGEAWARGRVCLPLEVQWNETVFGRARGDVMAVSFPDLVAHAARTRALPAGTIIGSGTVANTEYREVGSSCIAERRAIEMIEQGAPVTGFLRFGDRVRMEARGVDGATVFGAIDQRVVKG